MANESGIAHRNGAAPEVAEKVRPYYTAVGREEAIFKAAYRQGLALVLKGPTGCGKTRFVEAMAHDLDRPLITVACHDDLTTADLVGRYLLKGDETVWVDGPLTHAVREGAICYLDEVVEARQDTTVVLHPLADHRRQLPIERLGVTLDAAPGFGLVVSYNPGYQSVLKDLKDSTRQR
ncbi:MAG: nitric oxide reductase NorQ protein, partial [Mycobacterium sp.]|nr:nitric oxide reductase NorQ protein [Mycobacterium sp.]